MSWKDLDIKLKAELIKLGVLSGIRDIKLIRLLYDDNNTPTLVVELSYNETNVMPLLGIERIVRDYGIPEEEVNKANDIIQLIEKEISLEEINNQLPILFRLFNKGGYVSNNPTLTYSGGGPIKRKRENSLDWRMAVYNAVDPRSTVKNIDDAFRLYNAAVAKEKRGEDFKDYTLNNNIGDLTSDAAWRKRLELPYDETLLPVWNGDTVSLSRPLELEIPVDTNLVKDRIDYAQNEFWNDVKSLNLRQLKEDLSYKKSQEELLDALRYTYKTGKPIGVSEYHANSIDPEKVLKDFKYGISPLNVLGRYNIRYDKDENKMYYSDEWDFNQYEWAVPGTTFRIRGAIPLDKKKNGGKVKKYSKGGYKNPDEPPVLESTYVELPTLNILELELLNYLLSNPTAEQEYFRNLAVLNMTAPQSNLGVIQTKGEQDLVDKAFLGYNNFRYSHPWAKGLSYTPIIGDGMDLISLVGDVNSKDYMTAGLGLGMLALPNFILKPLLKYGKKTLLQKVKNTTWDKHYLKAIQENNVEQMRKLFDLHLKSKMPENSKSVLVYHGSRRKAPLQEIFIKSPERKTYGFYTTPDIKYAKGYTQNTSGLEPQLAVLVTKNLYEFPTYKKGYAISKNTYENLVALGYDSGITYYKNSIPEYISFNPNLIKSNNLITYNKRGDIIPLSKRHNFFIPYFNYNHGGFLFPNLAFSHKFEK